MRRSSQRRDAERALVSAAHDPLPEVARVEPVPERWRYGRYLALLVLLPLIVFLLTFPFAASQFFLRVSTRSLWHATHYRFVMAAQQNCEVVIAGDSSGMIGVDPHAIEARTGWKTCNVALPYIGTALAGPQVLDNYLAHNQPPRFIVFHLSANHLHRPVLDEDNGIVDGWLMVDEHFPLREKLRIFVSHPLDTLRFVTAVWKQFLATQPILRPDWSGETFRNDMREQQTRGGWMPERGTTEEVVCGWQPSVISTDGAYLHRLAAQYTRAGTQVVLWTNPARDCDRHIAEYRRNAAALSLPPTAVYDRSLFFDAFHLNTEGAARNGVALAGYLKSVPLQTQN